MVECETHDHVDAWLQHRAAVDESAHLPLAVFDQSAHFVQTRVRTVEDEHAQI